MLPIFYTISEFFEVQREGKESGREQSRAGRGDSHHPYGYVMGVISDGCN